MGDKTVEKIPIHKGEIMRRHQFAGGARSRGKLLQKLNDFIDCIILSSALNNCDVLVTEDNEIHALTENQEYLDLVLALNPAFKIQRLTDF